MKTSLFFGQYNSLTRLVKNANGFISLTFDIGYSETPILL